MKVKTYPKMKSVDEFEQKAEIRIVAGVSQSNVRNEVYAKAQDGTFFYSTDYEASVYMTALYDRLLSLGYRDKAYMIKTMYETV